MKSPMVKNAGYIKEKTGYSELQVLRSGAGYYIGTIYTDPETGFREPGSRDSDYFSKRESAEKFLEELTKVEAEGGDISPFLRDRP